MNAVPSRKLIMLLGSPKKDRLLNDWVDQGLMPLH